MYKRDLITVEIQKLAEVLSKILGLKLEGKIEEADTLFNDTLQDKFGLSTVNLFSDSTEDFETLIISLEHPAEKLDMLSQFIYSNLTESNGEETRKILAQKLLKIYSILEINHRTASFENLQRQKLISKYL